MRVTERLNPSPDGLIRGRLFAWIGPYFGGRDVLDTGPLTAGELPLSSLWTEEMKEWMPMMDDGFGARKVLDNAIGADFVEVMFAKSLDEAKTCCHLLEDVHIPSRFENAPDADRGIAVLVPEDRLVDASELLAARVQHDSVDESEGKAVADEEDVEDIDDVDDDDELDDDDEDDDFGDDADDEDDEDEEDDEV